MNIVKTSIEGVFMIEPQLFEDSRGYFFESFRMDAFVKDVADVRFVQENESCSSKYVIRGLHYQNPPYSQAKLVRCVRGRIVSLALDLRMGSETYGKCLQIELGEDNKLFEFIPHGFAHGFISLEDKSIVQYKCDNYYHREQMFGVNVLDPALGIVIPIGVDKAIVSDADRQRPLLKDINSPFFM
jgi:dTDP-4-dehydrorhamnose 3,5-epimerase